MAGTPKPEETPAPRAWTRRIRRTLDGAGTAARSGLDHLPGRKKRPAMSEAQALAGASSVDDTQGSPTDLADADVAVQRAWKHARWAVVITLITAQAVIALVFWRIKAQRAGRRGRSAPPAV